MRTRESQERRLLVGAQPHVGPCRARKDCGGPRMFPTLLQSLKQVGPGTACVCVVRCFMCVSVCVDMLPEAILVVRQSMETRLLSLSYVPWAVSSPHIKASTGVLAQNLGPGDWATPVKISCLFFHFYLSVSENTELSP